MARKPRIKVPKKAKAGQIIQIKTLFSHKMETGLRKNKKTGKTIPRKIINNFACNFNGDKVISADLYPAIAANPYFAFFAKVSESGTFDFAWTEDGGKVVSAQAKISVT